MTIGGDFTNFVQGITQVNFGPGISVGGAAEGAPGPVTVTGPTSATAQIAIDPAAVLGPRTPVAQSGSEQAPYAGGFSVMDTVTGAPPTVSVTAPAESQQVTGPVTITGTVTSPNLASWSLQYELAGTSTWTQFASGNTATVNATFDPILLLNGTIQIQLTAIDTSGQSTATVVNTIVTGARKVGLFTLSYTDLSVPLAGIPIQVTRTYDSRVKSVGDFGVGWTLGLRSSRVTVNGPIGGNWQGVFDQNLFANCMEATAPHIEARRDWGHAREYVRAMWLMLQQPSPDDYVIATGETHSVGEFAQAAFAEVGLDYRDYVTDDQRLYRPAEVKILQGDYSKARQKLGWSPAIKFHALVKEMVAADCEAIRSPQR